MNEVDVYTPCRTQAMHLLATAARVSYKALSDAAGKAAMFLVLIAAARALPVGAFGLLALASTLGWILAVAADFGLQLHLAREIARAPGRLPALFRPIFRLRLLLAAGAIGLSAAGAAARLPPIDAAAFTGIVAAFVTGALVEFVNHVFRAIGRSEVESTLNLVQRLSTLAAALVLLHLHPRLESAALALLLPPLLALGVSLGLLPRVAGAWRPAPAPPPGDAAPSVGAHWRAAFPIGLGIVLSALYFRIDVFLLEYWRGVEEVGRYAAVFRLIDALRLFPAAVVTVALPSIFDRRDARFSRRLAPWLFLTGVVLASASYAAGPRVVDLAYGAAYAAAVPAFRVLALALPFLSLNYGLTHELIGRGEARVYARLCGWALVVNVAANVLLIPRLGGAGAAYATVATELFLTAALARLLRRHDSRG